MTNFIANQSNWYLDKADKLNAVCCEMKPLLIPKQKSGFELMVERFREVAQAMALIKFKL